MPECLFSWSRNGSLQLLVGLIFRGNSSALGLSSKMREKEVTHVAACSLCLTCLLVGWMTSNLQKAQFSVLFVELCLSKINNFTAQLNISPPGISAPWKEVQYLFNTVFPRLHQCWTCCGPPNKSLLDKCYLV